LVYQPLLQDLLRNEQSALGGGALSEGGTSVSNQSIVNRADADGQIPTHIEAAFRRVGMLNLLL